MASLRAQDGFAREVTGGAGGPVDVARDGETFRALAGDSLPSRVIYVEGQFDINQAEISPNRTIIGRGPSPTLKGTLYLSRKSRNIIIQNLTITNPKGKKSGAGEDAIGLRNANGVWIDHCTIYDSPDGLLDMTHGTDKVTISWCKFYYTNPNQKHRFTMLSMGSEEDWDERIDKRRDLRVTLHHNWWAENCDSRMPAARLAKVHMYNNYFSCENNSYCSNARPDTQMLSESNYYDGVKNPCYKEGDSRLKTVNNIYDDCEGKAETRNDDVFKPPYKYSVDPVRQVPEIVRRGAGAR